MKASKHSDLICFFQVLKMLEIPKNLKIHLFTLSIKNDLPKCEEIIKIVENLDAFGIRNLHDVSLLPYLNPVTFNKISALTIIPN